MCLGHRCAVCDVTAKYAIRVVGGMCNDIRDISIFDCNGRSLLSCPFCEPAVWTANSFLNSFLVCRNGENWLAVSLMSNTPLRGRVRTNAEVTAMSYPAEPECDCQGCNYYG